MLASGVYAVRFDFANQQSSWAGYSELEAIGTPVAAISPLPSATALTVAASSTLDLNGANQQVASLSDSSGSGSIILNSATGKTSILTLAPTSGSTIFSGVIENNGGSGGTIGLTLNSSGTGTQVLTGANTYTGGTIVTKGTLQVNSGATLGPGNLTIASTGTVTFQNAAQTVAVASNSGTLNVSSGAVLTVTGGLTLASGSNTNFTLGTPNGTSGTAALIASTGNITNSRIQSTRR